jgi:hypothetical protein
VFPTIAAWQMLTRVGPNAGDHSRQMSHLVVVKPVSRSSNAESNTTEMIMVILSCKITAMIPSTKNTMNPINTIAAHCRIGRLFRFFRTCQLALIAFEMPDDKDLELGFLSATSDSVGVTTCASGQSLPGNEVFEQLTSSTLKDIPTKTRSFSDCAEMFAALCINGLDHTFSYQTLS